LILKVFDAGVQKFSLYGLVLQFAVFLYQANSPSALQVTGTCLYMENRAFIGQLGTSRIKCLTFIRLFKTLPLKE
jgi:hypothetical protein